MQYFINTSIASTVSFLHTRLLTDENINSGCVSEENMQ